MTSRQIRILVLTTLIILNVVTMGVKPKEAQAKRAEGSQIELVSVPNEYEEFVNYTAPQAEVVPVKQDIEYDKFTDYMVERGVTTERAHLILDTIKESGTKMQTSLILAVIENETRFRNIRAYTGDSVGYVQMQSKTRKWLKTLYPNLPDVGSQDEFLAAPEAQIKYMIAYLEYAHDKFNGNVDSVVSSYNMGLFSNKINHAYVKNVKAFRVNVEKSMI